MVRLILAATVFLSGAANASGADRTCELTRHGEQGPASERIEVSSKASFAGLSRNEILHLSVGPRHWSLEAVSRGGRKPERVETVYRIECADTLDCTASRTIRLGKVTRKDLVAIRPGAATVKGMIGEREIFRTGASNRGFFVDFIRAPIDDARFLGVSLKCHE